MDFCAYRSDESENKCHCSNKMIKVKNGDIPISLCNGCPWQSTTINITMLRPTGSPAITVAGPEIQGPGLVQMAQNFGAAMVTQAKATLEGKETFVPKEIYEQRLEICRGCEWFKNGRCLMKSCGCFINVKARLATSSCPDDPPKWTEYHISGTNGV